MRLNFNVPLGAQVAPFGSQIKCDLFSLAASIGSALIASGAESGAVEDTNETNREISESTNEYNYRLWQEQLAAQREQYQQEVAESRLQRKEDYEHFLENREYDSPKMVAQRFREAGINPYLAMQGSAGAVSSHSVPSGVSVPSKNVPSATPSEGYEVVPNLAGSHFFQNLGNSVMQYYQFQRENEREDYRLASDITATLTKNRIAAYEAATKAKEAGIEENRVNALISDADRQFKLMSDRFSSDEKFRDFERDMRRRDAVRAEYELWQKDKEIELDRQRVAIQRMLSRSQIKVDDASINNLNSQAYEARNRVYEMIMNGSSQREINRWIAKKEKEVYRQLEEENRTEMRFNDKAIGKAYKDFTNWLFTPIKGLISIGLK